MTLWYADWKQGCEFRCYPVDVWAGPLWSDEAEVLYYTVWFDDALVADGRIPPEMQVSDIPAYHIFDRKIAKEDLPAELREQPLF